MIVRHTTACATYPARRASSVIRYDAVGNDTARHALYIEGTQVRCIIIILFLLRRRTAFSVIAGCLLAVVFLAFTLRTSTSSTVGKLYLL